jgi:hypothetical protein
MNDVQLMTTSEGLRMPFMSESGLARRADAQSPSAPSIGCCTPWDEGQMHFLSFIFLTFVLCNSWVIIGDI